MESPTRMFVSSHPHRGSSLTPDSSNHLADMLFSASASPTKPLSFPSMPPIGSRRMSHNQLDMYRKEFNSSSDTYVSEHSDHLDSEKNTLLQRNFEDNANLEKTILGFLDLDHHEFDVPGQFNNNTQKSSPSRSIMKSSTSVSGLPKKSKSVNFQENNQVHHYQGPSQPPSEPESEDDLRISHNWNFPNIEKDKSPTQSPPLPPPHNSDTISSLLASREDEQDELDVGSLAKYKLNQGSFSNLSLNEKLNLYLNQQPHYTDDLDEHLDKLEHARHNETDANIHHLSKELELPKPHVEAPLNALSESHDVYLRSAGSSQSSLPSLVDSNRYLHSQNIEHQSPGLKIYDGIKGFSDHMAHTIIPLTNEDTHRPQFNMDYSSDSGVSSEEKFHDSFDQSYNLTEKSIMKLLNSASNLDLVKTDNQVNHQNQPQENHIKLEDTLRVKEELFVKTEPVSFSNGYYDYELQGEGLVDSEDEGDSYQMVFKQEPSNKTMDDYLIEFRVPLPGPGEDFSSRAILTDLQRSSSRLEELDKDKEPSQVNDSQNQEYPQVVPPEDNHAEDEFSRETHERELRHEEPSYEASQDQQDISQHDHEYPQPPLSETPLSRELQPEPQPQLPQLPQNEQPEPQQPQLPQDESQVSQNEQSETQHSQHDDSEKLEHDTHSTFSEASRNEISEPMLGIASKVVKPRRSAVKLVNSNQTSPVESPRVSIKQEDVSDVREMGADADEDADDEDEETQVKLETTHHVVQAAPKTLAPKPRVDEVVDATVPPSPVRPKVLPKATRTEDDLSILANSSNIQPPNNIRLPSLETSDHSLAEFSRKINDQTDSFEESLSAENEKDKNANDFLSIWHTQKSQIREQQKAALLHRRVSVQSIDKYNTADLSHYDRYRLPPTLQPRKIKETNVVSRRVFSPDHEDLHVSGFLPEISHVSGIEDHMHSLIRRESFSDILPDMEKERDEQEEIRRNLTRRMCRSLRPVSVFSREIIPPQKPQPPKKSKFHIPLFEIKRSGLMLSPKNQYDDIFEDTVFSKPTIRAPGMKTLPLMERGDVKKIMQMKNTMTQDEYTSLKFGGAPHKSVVQGLAESYDHMQQRASIHSDSVFSLPFQQDELPASDGFEKEEEEDPEPDADLISVKNEQKKEMTPTPESASNGVPVGASVPVPAPAPALATTPESAANYVPVGATVPIPAPTSPAPAPATPAPMVKTPTLKVTPKAPGLTPQTSPVKGSPGKTSPGKGSPIKIGLPIKVVKKGNAVAGVALDKKKKKEPNHNYALSTVSVPTTQAETVEEKPVLVRTSSSSFVPHEKGRLFLRVVGLKNIALPNLYERNATFNITLDNGVHCIKTPNYKMDKLSVLVGKEFELTVGELLEFILTMKTQYEKPRGTMREVKERRAVPASGRMSRLFGSKEYITTTRFVPEPVKDSWKGLIATDGSFARCYVDLQQYENIVKGKAGNFNLNCFNEWANGEPYTVAQLEVKMLFIPKTEPYEILPTSIKAAYEGLEDLKREESFHLEGFLHQEGGDCTPWKRRWFVLHGTSLVAHSEFSKKPRAKINLLKVVEVVYVDKENMNRLSLNYRNFSDILLVDHAFKIRFSNGEIIDFGAPNKEEKNRWIQAIQEVVYRNRYRRQPWVKMMHEKNLQKKPALWQIY